MIEIPIIIIAGGKSSRMGEDKALLPFGNYSTMVEYQYFRLKKIFKHVYISWKTEKKFIEKDISIFDLDEYKNISAPTVAILSIINFVKTGYFFVLSVDTPFFPEEAFLKLFNSISQNNLDEVVIASNNRGIEPLISIYHTSIYNKVKQMINDNNHSLTYLINHSVSNKIEFANEDIFYNLNYKTEYEQGLLWLKEIKK